MVIGVDGWTGVVASLLAATTTSVAAASASASSVTITTSSTTESAFGTTAGWSIASIATIATASTESTATASTALSSRYETLVDLEDLLSLALTLTLGLSGRCSDEVLFLFLSESLSVGPLLVLLAAFVWLAGLRDTGTKGKLLLGLLSEVISVGDGVVLWLGFSLNDTFSITGQGLFSLSFSNSFTGFLILELGSALICTPAMVSLLLGLSV